jgi:TonB family protein
MKRSTVSRPAKKLALAMLALSLTSQQSAHANTELSTQLATIVDAKALNRDAPIYPVSAAKTGAEGWVQLSYTIEPDGSVANVIVENSSGIKSFEHAALTAAKQWTFTPATENGENIQQCQNTVQMNFAMQQSTVAVSRPFRSKYHKAQQALANNEFEKVKLALDELKAMKKYRLAEEKYLRLLNLDYAQKIDDKKLQLRSLPSKFEKASVVSNQQQLSLLNQRLLLEVSFNELNAALATYQQIMSIPESEPYADQFNAIKQRIEDYIRGEQYIVVDGQVNDHGIWRYSLTRNQFSITEVQGVVHELDIRCANKRHLFSFAANNEWKIPDQWQKCSVYVKGDTNTAFKLVELPNLAHSNGEPKPDKAE